MYGLKEFSPGFRLTKCKFWFLNCINLFLTGLFRGNLKTCKETKQREKKWAVCCDRNQSCFFSAKIVINVHQGYASGILSMWSAVCGYILDALDVQSARSSYVAFVCHTYDREGILRPTSTFLKLHMLNVKTAVLLPLMAHSLAHLNKVIFTMSIFFEKTTLKFPFLCKISFTKVF